VKELLRISNTDEVNAMNGVRGQTVLHIAAFQCHQQVLATLLEDIKTNIWATDNRGRTALHWAAEACMYKFLERFSISTSPFKL
jgi:ankyrin repeat protein